MKSPAEHKAALTGEREAEEELSPTTTISIDETVRGKRYQATFVYEVPTLGDQILIGQLKNKYLPDGGQADPLSAHLVEQICYLEVTLKGEKPAWWTPMTFRESDLIAKLYVEGVAYANRFLGRDADDGAADSPDAGGLAGSGAPGNEGDVGEDLPGADERSPTVISHSARAR
jgi:hypothetical protein